MNSIKLIVGLGNPGRKYQKTRHNIGFMFIDSLANKHNLTLNDSAKHYGIICKENLYGHSVWLLKPQTYMNLSGKSVASLLNFYKINIKETLVVYDELDLPVGTAKLKKGGGHGGHNGLRDIIAATGSKEFYRLRLGIGHPGDKSKVVSWVLNRATTDEEISQSLCIDKGISILPDLLEGNLEKAMKDLHTKD